MDERLLLGQTLLKIYNAFLVLFPTIGIAVIVGALVPSRNGPDFIFFKPGIFAWARTHGEQVYSAGLIALAVGLWVALAGRLIDLRTVKGLGAFWLGLGLSVSFLVCCLFAVVPIARNKIRSRMGKFLESALSCPKCSSLWTSLIVGTLLMLFPEIRPYACIVACAGFAFALLGLQGVI